MAEIVVPRLDVLYKARGLPQRDATAVMLHWLGSRPKGLSVPLSASWERSLCGRELGKRVRERLVEAGVIRLSAPAVPQFRAAEYEASLPEDGWHLYRLRGLAAIRRFRATRGTNLSAEAAVQCDSLRHTLEIDLDGLARFRGSMNRYWPLVVHSRSWSCGQDRWGRFYSPCTQMPKESRAFLRLRGRRLAKVDIANCTPLLAGVVAAQEGAEGDQFLDDCQSGAVYELLAADMSQTRDAAKRSVLWLMNDCSPGVPQTEFSLVFAARYPVFAEWMEATKAKTGAGLHSKVTPLEAEIVLSAVAALIEGGIPAASIHDCVLVPVGMERFAEAALADRLQRHMPVTAVFHRSLCALDAD